ncbi:hypothetical protein ACEE23_00425 [Corynebacterium sp. 32222D000AT]|uniref:hypothetical protein n=1 Tax=unclassified Corynebacterium TaxID=2624378 RepID=UPI002A9D2F5B|nr:hypothetical protein [Mycobacteriaceae bacterium]MDY5829502.1 hypothetical protein [Corynebacterium sp.]
MANNDNPGVTIPLQLRVGGAFIAVALVLVIMTIVAVLTEGWMSPFVWTPARVALVVAALIIGAFATIRKDQRPSITQVVALGGAVLIIIASRFLPSAELAVMGQWWLLIYAGLALVCALVLRRSLAPRS